MARSALAVFLSFVAACGLYQGAAEVTNPPSDASMPDTTVITDAMMQYDTIPVPDAAPDCDAGMINDAILVLAGAGGCPNGTMTEPLVMNPVAGMGACTCAACTPTQAPACSGNGINWTYGNSQCNQGPTTFSINDSTCHSFGFTFTAMNYNGWTQMTPSAGVCTAAAQPDTSKVQTTPLVRCVVPAMRPDILCGAEKLGGYKFCVPAGDGGCSGRFSQLVGAGTDATVACDPCSCSHTATTCTIDYFSNSNCSTKTYTRTMNGQCEMTGNPSGNSHFKVYATGTSCTSIPGAAKVGLTGAVRMCCEP